MPFWAVSHCLYLDLRKFKPPFPLECPKNIQKTCIFQNTFWWASAIRCQLFSPDQRDLYHQFLLLSSVHPHHQDDIPCMVWHYTQILQKMEYKNMNSISTTAITTPKPAKRVVYVKCCNGKQWTWWEQTVWLSKNQKHCYTIVKSTRHIFVHREVNPTMPYHLPQWTWETCRVKTLTK